MIDIFDLTEKYGAVNSLMFSQCRTSVINWSYSNLLVQQLYRSNSFVSIAVYLFPTHPPSLYVIAIVVAVSVIRSSVAFFFYLLL